MLRDMESGPLFEGIEFRTEDVPRNAGHLLDLKNTLGGNLVAAHPVRDGLLLHAKLSGQLGLAASVVYEVTDTGSLFHEPAAYRNALLCVKGDPVGMATGRACSIPAVANDEGKAKHRQNAELGKAIADARVKANYTQASLAEAMGIRQQSVADWEIGRTSPRGGRLKLLLQLLPSLTSKVNQQPHLQVVSKSPVVLQVTQADIDAMDDNERKLVVPMIKMIEGVVQRLDTGSRPARGPKS